MDPVSLSVELGQRYEQQWQKLPGVRGYYLNTSLGQVWVAEAGDENKPPLFAIHGLQTPAPFFLELLWPLTQHFRVITVDIPGQAGKTPGMAPLPSNKAYALWLEQVLDALQIGSCPMVALSFGGAILLDLANLNPQRIRAASLIFPAGFFRPVWRPLKKLFAPLIGFKLHSDRMHFDLLMKPLMEDNWPELEAYYYAVFQAGLPMTLLPPGPYHCEDLLDFNAPVQLFCASEDIYFDPDKLEKQAQKALMNLQEVQHVDDLHIPSPEQRKYIQDQVLRFMRCNGGL